MNKIFEYILENYTLILGAIIVIILAIIGSYADRTDFGQKSLRTKNDKAEDDLSLKDEEEIQNKKDDSDIDKKVEEDTTTIEDVPQPNKEDFEDKFDQMSQEVEEFLPKKDLIDGDLLDEIENLSLDKTQKIKLEDIPDLDDVELPKIKDLKSDDDDIWKI